MADFSLNNTVPEPDRSMEVIGFNNVSPTPTTGRPSGQGHGLGHPLQDHVVDHSNTEAMRWPTPSGDFARRTS